MEKLYTISGLSELTGVSQGTLRMWHARKWLKPVAMGGNGTYPLFDEVSFRTACERSLPKKRNMLSRPIKNTGSGSPVLDAINAEF